MKHSLRLFSIGYTAATFGNSNQDSYVQYTIPEPQKTQLASSVDLSMFIRTRKEQGLIFYIGGDPETDAAKSTFISAYIVEGQLQVLTQAFIV